MSFSKKSMILISLFLFLDESKISSKTTDIVGSISCLITLLF